MSHLDRLKTLKRVWKQNQRLIDDEHMFFEAERRQLTEKYNRRLTETVGLRMQSVAKGVRDCAKKSVHDHQANEHSQTEVQPTY